MDKTIFKHILLLTMALSFAGCSGLLDMTPPMNEVEDNFYRNEEDMYKSLTSAYNVLLWSAPKAINGGAQNCAFEIVSEILGDCCYAGGAYANDAVQTSRVDRFSMRVSDLYPEALWHKYYTGIYRCNKFFEKVDGAEFKDEDLRAMYKAECHFLRAYYYFDLVRLFGNVPLILKSLSPADYAQVQAAPSEVYAQIAEDLLASINAVKEDGTSAMYVSSPMVPLELKGRVTQDAAKSLLCRVWLYYTGYYAQTELPGVSASEMIAMVEEVADNTDYSFLADAYAKDATSGVSPLWNVANKNCSEEVFTIQYSSLSKWGDWSNREGCTGNQAVILWGIRDVSAPYAAGWSFAPVAKRLFEAYSQDDPRRWATIINANPAEGDNDGEGLKYTEGFQNTGYFCRKFTPLVANNATSGSRELNYPNNYPAIRWSDVLLMASEMEFRYGAKDKAHSYYAKVRERALGTGSAGTVADLTLGKILDERLYELALEGHRYWDVLRQGETVAASILTNGEEGDYEVVYDSAKKGLMPIPQYDITQSKNSLVQNPGY
ncbi:MAG: RagB/SusD family nutrient uptake outer membrane protein [Candidatus Cryptobacteroides sp.]